MRHLSGYFFLIGLLVFLASCDPCRSTVCMNNGSCENGDCVCPPGYTGSDCSLQETPLFIKINRIDVTRFPGTIQGGASWDITSGPDIYPVILMNGNEVYKHNDFYQNADPNLLHLFLIDPVAELNEPHGTYLIRLMDFDDFDADDVMGEISFTPYHNENSFPDVIELDNGGRVAFKLFVSYVW